MKYLVILDSGHAEYVEGKQAPDKSLREWDFNNQMQYKLKKALEEQGISVFLTNPNPQKSNEMGLTKRTDLANSYWKNNGKPNALFMSIHANAYGSEFNAARGTETYVADNASSNSKRAAKDVNDEIVKTMKSIDPNAKDRGVKTSNFTVIYKANMPSILVEYGFYTNKDDLKILKNEKDKLVKATVIGICKYFGIDYKEQNNNTPINKPSNDNNNGDDVYYRVVAGSYKDKSNAQKVVDELKNKGYNAFIVTYKK